MTNLELLNKIKAEIERLKVENRNIRCQHNENYCTGYDNAFNDLLPVINSLSEEKLQLLSGLFSIPLLFHCL